MVRVSQFHLQFLPAWRSKMQRPNLKLVKVDHEAGTFFETHRRYGGPLWWAVWIKRGCILQTISCTSAISYHFIPSANLSRPQRALTNRVEYVEADIEMWGTHSSHPKKPPVCKQFSSPPNVPPGCFGSENMGGKHPPLAIKKVSEMELKQSFWTIPTGFLGWILSINLHFFATYLAARYHACSSTFLTYGIWRVSVPRRCWCCLMLVIPTWYIMRRFWCHMCCNPRKMIGVDWVYDAFLKGKLNQHLNPLAVHLVSLLTTKKSFFFQMGVFIAVFRSTYSEKLKLHRFFRSVRWAFKSPIEPKPEFHPTLATAFLDNSTLAFCGAQLNSLRVKE